MHKKHENPHQQAAGNNHTSRRRAWPVRVFMFYRDGFSEMTVGKKLWALILVKLFILFAVVKVLFFPDLLKSNYATDSERSAAVRNTLLDRGAASQPGIDAGTHAAPQPAAADTIADLTQQHQPAH